MPLGSSVLLLGLPEEHWPADRALGPTTSARPSASRSNDDLPKIEKALIEMEAYLDVVIDERQRQRDPGKARDDLITTPDPGTRERRLAVPARVERRPGLSDVRRHGNDARTNSGWPCRRCSNIRISGGCWASDPSSVRRPLKKVMRVNPTTVTWITREANRDDVDLNVSASAGRLDRPGVVALGGYRPADLARSEFRHHTQLRAPRPRVRAERRTPLSGSLRGSHRHGRGAAPLGAPDA